MTALNFPTRLYAMLTYKRPHLSKGEADWIKNFLTPYNPTVLGKPGAGALCIEVKREDGSHSKTLFSCHTDTVHRKTGRQTPVLKDGYLEKRDDECLGADDGAGAWIMLEMIDAKVPGVYLFHRGEECGGIGSSALAREMPEWLGAFDRAVAFDRRGVTDIITHQRGGRCCSDAFAEALADQLNVADETFVYAANDGGSFTDTANYTGLIGECTNVSCGYEREHGPNEKLFVPHVMALAAACKKVDWEALPVARKPGEREYKSRFPTAYSSNHPGRAYAGNQRYPSLAHSSKPEQADLLAWDGVGGFGDDVADVEYTGAGQYANYFRNKSKRSKRQQELDEVFTSGTFRDPYDDVTALELADMTEDSMIEFAMINPEHFVALVRECLGKVPLSDTEPDNGKKLAHGMT